LLNTRTFKNTNVKKYAIVTEKKRNTESYFILLCMGEERKVYRALVVKPEGKRPLERPRRRWEDGIRMDLREIGLWGCGLDSTGSEQVPVAGCCECGDEPSGSCATELVSYAKWSLPFSSKF
jgi:hypothetical protein